MFSFDFYRIVHVMIDVHLYGMIGIELFNIYVSNKHICVNVSMYTFVDIDMDVCKYTFVCMYVY